MNERAQTLLKKVEPRENVLWGEIPDLVCHPDGSRGDADGVIAGTNERGCDLHASCLPLLGPAEAGADLTPPGADERFHGLRVDPAIRALVAVARCLAGQAGQHRLAVLCPAPVVKEVGGPHVVAQIGSSIAAKPAERVDDCPLATPGGPVMQTNPTNLSVLEKILASILRMKSILSAEPLMAPSSSKVTHCSAWPRNHSRSGHVRTFARALFASSPPPPLHLADPIQPSAS